jgi:hypothetical protein
VCSRKDGWCDRSPPQDEVNEAEDEDEHEETNADDDANDDDENDDAEASAHETICRVIDLPARGGFGAGGIGYCQMR